MALIIRPTSVFNLSPEKLLELRKKDRNGNGDVSHNEFIGSRADFDSIDTDHDGLISLDEAEAADAACVRRNDHKRSASPRG